MSFADKSLACRDCGAQFVFTAGEQEFFDLKGFTNPPSRCPECRAKAKSSQRGARRMDSGPREMHDTTCAGCGKTAQVPFLPRGDKPVYCSDCFQSQRASRW